MSRRWVVVGGGTAGCVVAAGLARSAANDVLLIERGSVAGRVGSRSTFDDLVGGGPWDWLTVVDDGNVRAYPLGDGLGGTTRLNGALVGIGAGNPAASEIAWPGGDAWAGELVPDSELGAVDRALLAAAPDAATVRLLRRDGRLFDAADAVQLGALTVAGNLRVRSGVAVRSVQIAGDRAAGVVLDDGERVAADAVVLCAGAVGSAVLLLRAAVDVAGLGAVRQHAGRVIDLVLHRHARWDPAALVTGAGVRRGATEMLALNHLGPHLSGRAGLLVGWLAGVRRGSIEICDDPASTPMVDFGMLSGTPDAAGLAAAEEVALELLAHPAFVGIVAEQRHSPALSGYFHAGSSCARGTVLDDDGGVVGYARLFVADAASLPDLPVEATMMIAVVAEADRFAARWVDRELG